MLNVMKTRAGILFVAVMLVLSAFQLSCERTNNENKATGSIKFSVSLSDQKASRSVSSVADSSKTSLQLLVTITDLNGKTIMADTLLPLYAFGTGWISRELEMETGAYQLTKFMIINTSGEVVYATPLKDAPLAYLCKDPLPLTFTIASGQTSSVIPEVLVVGSSTPEQFGYATFGMQIINPLEFFTVCYLDNPLLMAPVKFTTANLTVFSPDGWSHLYKLEAAVNDIIIRGGYENYTFVIEKEGYTPQKLILTAKELLATGKDNPLVLRIPVENYGTLIIQPGPEGKDAMISNLEPDKNFGNYKYFEATFLSEPVLTVMRSNRSLIAFSLDSLPKSAIIKKVMLTLTYDLPVPFDSSFTTDSVPTATNSWYGGVLQQIIEPWDEMKVTWNTQPKTTEANQVYIAPFIRNTNMIMVDVTRLFVNPSASLLPNYGMLFKLWPTDKFPGFRFGSGDYAEPKMRPLLMVNYTL